MKCVNCDTSYRVRVDDEATQFARNTCQCEKEEKCYFKSKCKGKVIQTELEADGETVVRYRCREHSLEDLLDPSAPVIAPPVIAPPLPKDPESMEGMVIEQKSYIARKAQVIADVKSDTFHCRCSGCGKTHKASQRKVVADENNETFHIVCPSCGAPGYVFLD